MMQTPRTYFLTSNRLGFSHWTPEDLSLAQQLWGNLEVTRYIDARGQLTKIQVQEKLEKELQNQQLYGLQYFPLFLKDDHTFIGCCGLRPYDLEKQVLEIGFHIIPEFWRKGYALEAAQAMINFAFDQKDVTALFAGHNPKNDASRQLLLKLGFVYLKDEFYAPTGLCHPSYILQTVK